MKSRRFLSGKERLSAETEVVGAVLRSRCLSRKEKLLVTKTEVVGAFLRSRFLSGKETLLVDKKEVLGVILRPIDSPEGRFPMVNI